MKPGHAYALDYEVGRVFTRASLMGILMWSSQGWLRKSRPHHLVLVSLPRSSASQSMRRTKEFKAPRSSSPLARAQQVVATLSNKDDDTSSTRGANRTAN